jgi:ribosomal protein S12 methylthiotransferase
MSPEDEGAPRRIYLETLGCEKNLVDSEGALGLMLERGFEITDRIEDAQLVVLNTCGFLESARRESMDRLHELAEAKGQAQLVAMGCLVQGQTHDLRREIPGLDHVLGVGQYHRLAELAVHGEDPPLESPDLAPYAGYGSRKLLTPSHVAHLKIAEGCNQSCSFCKIPALRGRQRSRTVPELLAEAHRLVAQGVRELILIGQNTSAYGIDLPGQPRLGDLCRALSSIPALRWIRIMYAYPPMLTPRLLDEVYSVDKVVSYLDIPVQHASKRVLERMQRGYDRDAFLRRIEELRRLRPEVMTRSTALLGFPGETEDDVVQLMDFLAEVGFDHLATFVYSHEEQTTAGAWVDDVELAEKEDRRARVESLQWDLGQELKERRLGHEVELVVDEVFADATAAELEAIPLSGVVDADAVLGNGPVAFARSEGFCHEIDGGVWLRGDALEPGDFCRGTLVDCGPFDFLAERREDPA